jgi:hypothetical protein
MIFPFIKKAEPTDFPGLKNPMMKMIEVDADNIKLIVAIMNCFVDNEINVKTHIPIYYSIFVDCLQEWPDYFKAPTHKKEINH